MVSEMLMEEKIAVVSGQTNITTGCAGIIPGVPRVGFPGICVNDGPNGLHGVDAVSAYASGITVGASWNKDLTTQRGFHMGLEAKRKGGEWKTRHQVHIWKIAYKHSKQSAWPDGRTSWSHSVGR